MPDQNNPNAKKDERFAMFISVLFVVIVLVFLYFKILFF